MKLENHIFGSLSFYFLAGYLTLIVGLILIFTSKTPVYGEVASSLAYIPLSTILAASPLALIIGVVVDHARRTINTSLLKRSRYAIGMEGAKHYEELLLQLINDSLHGQGQERATLTEDEYLNVRPLLLPGFDEYSVISRWVHDLLDITIFLAVLTEAILLFRWLVNTSGAVEFYLFLIMAIAACFSIVAQKQLRLIFTQNEIALIIKQYSQEDDGYRLAGK